MFINYTREVLPEKQLLFIILCVHLCLCTHTWEAAVYFTGLTSVYTCIVYIRIRNIHACAHLAVIGKDFSLPLMLAMRPHRASQILPQLPGQAGSVSTVITAACLLAEI